MELQYIVNPADLANAPHSLVLVDKYAKLWHRPGPNSFWEDGTGRVRNHHSIVIMRGPVYLLPGETLRKLDLDGLSRAAPGDYVLDCHGDRWGKTTAGRWLLDEGDDPRSIVKKSEDLLDAYGPLLPAPRPGDFYVRPVSAMEAAAREEEARPVSFWRRLWNGLVWG